MENKNKGRKKKRQYPRLCRAAALMFICILAVINLINFAVRDKTFSEKENRKAAQKPEVTLSGLLDGSFAEQYAEYKSDQFVGRDFWVTVKANAELLTGKREQQDIFMGKDSYLLEAVVKPDNERLEKNLQAVKEFQAVHSDIPFYFMLVPGAANVLSDKLPAFAVTEDQTAQFEYIKEELGQSFEWVDVRKALTARKDEEIYYHTDPRWTTLGAYYAYQELAEEMKLDLSKAPKLQCYAVTGDFNGMLSAASGYEGSYREPVCIYSAADPEDNTKAVVNYVEEGRKTATLYDSSKLEGGDKYSVFFGGNFPLIEIRTAADSDGQLLIIKDSYANCLVPFLAPYFREIVMVDPEYYEGDMDQLIKDYEITSVLFLYGGNTFMEDVHISGVLADDETE